MRLRPVLLSAAVASAAVVAVVPSSAQAATQCTIVMPTKVVINAETVESPVRFGSNCAANGADEGAWDLDHSSGTIDWIWFSAEEFAEGRSSTEWYDSDPMGRYVVAGAGAYTAEGTALSQNSPVTVIKYHSRFAGSVKRSSTGGLTWSVTAQQWSGRAHAYVGRSKVNVGLFHRATGSTTWTYVKSATTTSTGRATVTMSTPKSGSYRLKVAETPSVWASYTSIVRGRI
jgi:hypothetical protein